MGLAVPLRWGQTLKVSENQGAEVHWISKDAKGQKWFECKLNLIDFSIDKTTDEQKAQFIRTLIKSAAQLNSDFLSKWKKYRITSELEFDPEWGLGSSSTLIANLAEWAELSPFELYFDTQEGSGYDVAAAVSDSPFLYQKSETELTFETFDWDQKLMENIFVFYLGNKQSTAAEVNEWKKNKRWNKGDINHMNTLSESLAECEDVDQAMELFREHLKMMEKILDQRAFEGRYADFEGVMKPMGAWGGDFGLALSPDPEYTMKYLNKQGLAHVFRLSEIVL